MKNVKPEARLLGVDDAPFEFEDDDTEIIGTVFRGSSYIEGVLMRRVEVDGFDITENILDMVNGSRHRDQVQAVLLDGITYAGFNIVDIEKVAEEGGVGVIVVSRNRPERERMDRGLENVDRVEERKKLIDKAGEAKEHRTGEGTVYYQNSGMDDEKSREVLELSTVRGHLPEPIRVAHLIGAALKKGESRGGA